MTVTMMKLTKKPPGKTVKDYPGQSVMQASSILLTLRKFLDAQQNYTASD